MINKGDLHSDPDPSFCWVLLFRRHASLDGEHTPSQTKIPTFLASKNSKIIQMCPICHCGILLFRPHTRPDCVHAKKNFPREEKWPHKQLFIGLNVYIPLSSWDFIIQATLFQLRQVQATYVQHIHQQHNLFSLFRMCQLFIKVGASWNCKRNLAKVLDSKS